MFAGFFPLSFCSIQADINSSLQINLIAKNNKVLLPECMNHMLLSNAIFIYIYIKVSFKLSGSTDAATISLTPLLQCMSMTA